MHVGSQRLRTIGALDQLAKTNEYTITARIKRIELYLLDGRYRAGHAVIGGC